MVELIAKGKIRNAPITVLCEREGDDWRYTFNGEPNLKLEEQLRELTHNKTMCRVGTYPAKTMKLKLWNILNGGYFFDRIYPREVEVYGDIEKIPYADEEGVDY